MFSSRTPDRLTPNRYTLAVERRRRTGGELLDLTESNPTRAGIDYPRAEILAALADPGSLSYAPDPLGLPDARRAVARYYAARGVAVDERRVVLTASTSEAYTYLFKLLADPGDDVLVPTPSYPLFDHLARVEAVGTRPYRLEYHAGWRVDPAAVREALGSRSRLLVAVSPNNPTGSSLGRDELRDLVEICDDRAMALVCDEVFADYAYRDDPSKVRSVAEAGEVLTFTLNGLSKVAGLPQLKLGWIVVNGPRRLVEEALGRLEFVGDLFLSVGTPVQHALPRLLELAPAVRARIRERVTGNLEWLVERVGREGSCRVLPADGGWYASLRVPRILGDDELAVALVEEEGVAVHPGYFFEFPIEGILVVSLLTSPEQFREGIARLLGFVDRLCA